MRQSIGKLNSPSNELTQPLNARGMNLQSPLNTRIRKGTTSSDNDQQERGGNLKMNMDQDKKGALKQSRVSPEFKFNMEMSLRVAFGVLIASIIQTRNQNYTPGSTESKWFFFPDWYYLGGLSYCAVAVIFSAGRNIGGTLREVCQAFMGVGTALLYNLFLFSIIDVHNSEDPYKPIPSDEYFNVTKGFGSDFYYVNKHNFYVLLPCIMVFTVVILLLPIENNTKKFALGNNLFFTLTIINPMNPTIPKTLKTDSTDLFLTPNVLQNLSLYFLIGFIGSIISLFVMFFPYPVFAIDHLRKETLDASSDILDLLNIIVDSYCFKNKNVDHMNFLKLKLKRRFENAMTRHRKMVTLLEDVWWEQLLGIHVYKRFNRSILQNYVQLIGSLLADLRSLNNAMQLEQYGNLHFEFMSCLQRDIYLIQLRSGDLLKEISKEVHDSKEILFLQHFLERLENQMEITLQKYQSIQTKLLLTKKPPPSFQEMVDNLPLNLFLFSLNSFCSTLINFQTHFNEKNHTIKRRAQDFIIKNIQDFFSFCHTFDRLRYINALKVAMAIFIGIWFAVFVYSFSNTTPAAIAFVMGNHIGGSFSVTVNRVGGVVAGSVVPSVFQFFISQICNPRAVHMLINNAVLFFWVSISMYVRYNGGYGSYAGLVSAFISAGILLKPNTDDCVSQNFSSSTSISSYSSLAQTSVGIILFILVELAMCPESATSLLRRNIQKTLALLKQTFDVLFDHHLQTKDDTSSFVMNEVKLEEIRQILQVQVPALLVEQQKLLIEANAEPLLWKPAFSYQKYELVLESSHRLLNNNNLLFKLVKWFRYRTKQHEKKVKEALQAADKATQLAQRQHTGDAMAALASMEALQKEQTPLEAIDIRICHSAPRHKKQGEKVEGHDHDQDQDHDHDHDHHTQTQEGEEDKKQTTHQRWEISSRDFQRAVDDTFDTLQMLFGEGFLYADPDQTAIFMQMKEAFRLVDKDCSGEIDADEVCEMVQHIFSQSGVVEEKEIHRYVEQFMELVDKDQSGKVSFEEFMEALDDGLKFEVEVYHRRKTKGPSPQRPMLTRIASSRRRLSSSGAFEPTSLFTPKKRQGSTATANAGLLSPMRREHDVLNVEDISVLQLADGMKSALVEWLMEEKRFMKVSMEELLLLNCVVSGAEGIARHLTNMEEIVAAS